MFSSGIYAQQVKTFSATETQTKNARFNRDSIKKYAAMLQLETANKQLVRKETSMPAARVYAAKGEKILRAVTPGNARIVLTAGDVWGDGTGYQMLLDANATAYGTTIPDTGPLGEGDIPASIYAEFEYKIPVNADGSLTTSNIVFNNSIAIEIPAGTYDYCITNPSPHENPNSNKMWIADGSLARGDDFVFEAGKIYTFAAIRNGDSDLITISIFIADAPVQVANLVATPDPSEALSCELSWTNPEYTLDGDALTTIASIVIKRDGTIIHTMPNLTPGASETWTDATPSNGYHTYTVYATNNTADGVPDSTRVLVGIDPCTIANTTFPWNEGFEGAAIPKCWTQEHVSGITDWEVVATATGVPNTTHGGSYKARFYSKNRGVTTKLVTPKLDISSFTNPLLKFWHTQQIWDSDQDTLRVYYKNSAAGAWTLLSTYDNSITSWKEEIIDLPNVSADYYIAFEGKAQYGRGIQLDDIAVLDFTNLIDAALLSVGQPVSGANLTATESVSIVVKNIGSEPITSLPVTLEVNGTVVATENISNIASLTEAPYTFTATADLSAVQVHTVKVYTALASDIDLTNDTITKFVENYGDIAIMGSVDSIRSCNIRFTDNGVHQNYIPSGDQIITFYPATAGEMVSITFNELVTAVDPFGGYDAVFVLNGVFTLNDIGSLTNDQKLGAYAGNCTGDLPAAISALNKDGALTVYFKIGNYLGTSASGWDADITCVALPAIDAVVESVVAPAQGKLTDSDTITVTVTNHGSSTLNNIPVICTINGTALPTATIAGPLASFESTTQTFTVDLSVLGDYDIVAYTDIAGDENHANDTAKTSTMSLPATAITWDFEQGMPNNFTLRVLDNGVANSTTRFPNNEAWAVFAGDDGLTPIGAQCAVSQSWFSSGTGAANRWMITPKIELGENAMLQWDASCYQASYPDGYTIKLSTSGIDTASFTNTLYTTAAENKGWTNRKVDLSAYIGQQVYIAFIQNSNDQDIIAIDNIKLLGEAEIIRISENDILTFDLDELLEPAIIDAEAQTVSVTVVYGTDVSALEPTITISMAATINPPSGTPVDFTSGTATYTVTAEDGTEKIWTVYLNVIFISEEKEILTFEIPDAFSVYINSADSSISMEFPAGTNLSALTPVITVSPFASITPESGLVQDFSAPVEYTVTAQDSSKKTWTVTATTVDCPRPGNIAIDDIGKNSAKISWDGYTGSQWNLVLSEEELADPGTFTGIITGLTDTVYLAEDLEENRQYYVYISSECGMSGNSLWSSVAKFTTLKTIEYVSLSPVMNGVEVALNAPISVTFNQDITAIDLTGVTISPDPGNVSASVSGAVLSIAHSNFTYNTTYTVSIPDSAIVGYNSEISWSFKTKAEPATGVTELDLSGINLYPNPASTQVSLTGLPESAQVNLYNVKGTLIRQYQASLELTINIDLASGIYFVRVEKNGVSVTKKLMVE